MKKIIILSALSLFLSLGNCSAQVIVKVRPQRPKTVIIKPTKTNRNKVWKAGDWKWSRRTNSYYYIKGHWARRRGANVWVEG